MIPLKNTVLSRQEQIAAFTKKSARKRCKFEKVILDYMGPWYTYSKAFSEHVKNFKRRKPKIARKLIEDMSSWKTKDRLEKVSVKWVNEINSDYSLCAGDRRKALEAMSSDGEWLNKAYPLPKALFPASGKSLKGYKKFQKFFYDYICQVIHEKTTFDSELLRIAGDITRVDERGEVSEHMDFDLLTFCFNPDLLIPFLEGKSDMLTRLLELHVIPWGELVCNATMYWTSPRSRPHADEAFNLAVKECLPYLVRYTGSVNHLIPEFIGYEQFCFPRRPGRAQLWGKELVNFAQRGPRETELVRKHIEVFIKSAQAAPTENCLALRVLEAITAYEEAWVIKKNISTSSASNFASSLASDESAASEAIRL